MKDEGEWKELRSTLKVYAIWAVTTVVDSLFIALWIFVQWVVDKNVVEPLQLSGIDRVALFIFRFLFAISSLAPVAIKIYEDISIMFVKSQSKIRKAAELGRTHGTDKF